LSRPNWVARTAAADHYPQGHDAGDARRRTDLHLPADRRERPTWRHVDAELGKAAAGAADPGDVAIALRMVLMLESVECRLQ
jgi:hypothetical protein